MRNGICVGVHPPWNWTQQIRQAANSGSSIFAKQHIRKGAFPRNNIVYLCMPSWFRLITLTGSQQIGCFISKEGFEPSLQGYQHPLHDMPSAWLPAVFHVQLFRRACKFVRMLTGYEQTYRFGDSIMKEQT
jgi:hypothetical protein